MPCFFVYSSLLGHLNRERNYGHIRIQPNDIDLMIFIAHKKHDYRYDLYTYSYFIKRQEPIKNSNEEFLINKVKTNEKKINNPVYLLLYTNEL